MNASLPAPLSARVVDHASALERTVTSGIRIGSGLGTSEPHRFYAELWDHIREHDLRDLRITQALFLAPHPLLVGDPLAAMLDGSADPGRRIVGRLADLVDDLPVVGDAVGGALDTVQDRLDDVSQLRALLGHLDQLEERGIRFTSGFLGPATNTVVPDHPVIRAAAPKWAGRNRYRSQVAALHPVHFPDAADAFLFDPEGRLRIDLFVAVATPPNDDGELSFGLSNGANGDALDVVLDHPDATLLLYLNGRYPFTRGFPGGPNTLHVSRLERLADDGRLWVVEDDTAPPALPDGSFDQPSDAEVEIGRQVAEHITGHLDHTAGRALQLGIGGTGVQAVERLRGSDWQGRIYTEMLEPFTYGLLASGNATGSFYLDDSGQRVQVDDRIVCTFMIAERDDDFYDRPEVADTVLMGPATRVLLPEAFHGGLGINNVLSIDFNGHVNVSGRDANPWSGIGGSGVIHRGLAVGGVAYLCLKSTHRTPAGERRSSIFPALPEGTPVSLVGPDLMGTRDAAAFFLVTEQGIVQVNRRDQHDFIRALLSVAHPDFRDDLEREAWERYRVRV